LGRRHILLTFDVFGLLPSLRAESPVRLGDVPSEHISGRDVVHGHDSRAVESGAFGGEFVDVGEEFVVRPERE
jgi:hypothetical protein